MGDPPVEAGWEGSTWGGETETPAPVSAEDRTSSAYTGTRLNGLPLTESTTNTANLDWLKSRTSNIVPPINSPTGCSNLRPAMAVAYVWGLMHR